MIDAVHEHKCLIFLFGFNVQFVTNVTYLYSYISDVWWNVLRVDFLCPKPYFYISVINIASIISLKKLCRGPSARQHGLLTGNIKDIH